MTTSHIIEILAEQVHNAWWEEKKKQGFHASVDCPISRLDDTFEKFTRYCAKYHTDMYPYDELPENIKEYDRVTVCQVLKSLGELAS